MAKNLMGKTRPSDKPYLTFKSPDGTWEWKVLKSWQGDDSKPFARWFAEVSSPATFGGSDLGDTYVKDIVEYGVIDDWDREVLGENLENLTVPVRVL